MKQIINIIKLYLSLILLSTTLLGIPGLEIKLNNNILDKKENITTKSITLINNSNTQLDLIIKVLDWNRKDFNKSSLSKSLSIDKKFLILNQKQKENITVTTKSTLLDGEKFHLIKIGKSTLTHHSYLNVPNLMIPIIIKNSSLDTTYTTKFLTKNNQNYVKIKNIGNSIDFSKFEAILHHNNSPVSRIETPINLNHNESIEIPINIKKINNNLSIVLVRKNNVI